MKTKSALLIFLLISILLFSCSTSKGDWKTELGGEFVIKSENDDVRAVMTMPFEITLSQDTEPAMEPLTVEERDIVETLPAEDAGDTSTLLPAQEEAQEDVKGEDDAVSTLDEATEEDVEAPTEDAEDNGPLPETGDSLSEEAIPAEEEAPVTEETGEESLAPLSLTEEIREEAEESPLGEVPVVEEESADSETEETVEETVEADTGVESAGEEKTTELFSYAFGFKTMSDIIAEEISISGRYFARAVLDATASAIPVLVEPYSIQSWISKYVEEMYYMGIPFDKGERPESLESLGLLPVPTALPEAFSYAYTFSLVRELADGDVVITAPSFIEGALDALYGSTPVLDAEERQKAIDSYIDMLNRAYAEELEAKKRGNSEKAKAFFERNAMDDSVITLDSGIQLMIIAEDEEVGGHPSQYDIVLVDYNTYVMDYDTEDLSMIDADYGATLHLMEADTSLASSIVALRTGQAGRTWIPPELHFGDRNIEGIEPNSILVYDIALNAIIGE